MDYFQIVFFFFIIIPSAIIHEVAHGLAADRLGDPTARNMGRLTLNPGAHIDMWGTILMPLLLIIVSGGSFLFAYAKPVPYNPYNLQNPKRDAALIGLAGPVSNLLIALVFGLLVRFAVMPELTGLFMIITFANVLLAVFNLVPIPPLDGSKILFALLPETEIGIQIRQNLEKHGFMILIIFILFLFKMIYPLINWIISLIVGQSVLF